MTPSKRPDSFLKEVFHRKARWWVKALRTAAMTVLALVSMDAVMMATLSGRPLTAGEEKDLRGVFGSSLDYSKIKFHHSAVMNARMKVTGAAGETFGSAVALLNEQYKTDFSKEENIFSQFIFRHELTHVWQAQSCFHGSRFEALANGFNRLVLRRDVESIYSYKLEAGKDLTQYSIEQQADIVSDYVLVKQGVKAFAAEGANDIKLYESVLANFLKNPSYAAQKFCRKF